MERWADIEGFEGLYQVSDQGRVRSLDRVLSDGRRWRGGLLSTKKGGGRHVCIRLCKDGKHHWRGLHRLVLTAFVGPCPEGMEGAHNDGTPANNALDNLRWDTRSGNHADKVVHGTSAHGERNNLAKLSADDVQQIRRMRAEGALLSEIAQRFHVTNANVSSIINHKTWAHLEDAW